MRREKSRAEEAMRGQQRTRDRDEKEKDEMNGRRWKRRGMEWRSKERRRVKKRLENGEVNKRKEECWRGVMKK